MRLTLSKKLGFSFSIIIGLMAISAFVAHQKASQVEETIRLTVDESFPGAMQCSSLLGNVVQTTSSIRGYLLLGADPERAEYFKGRRAEAWRNIDTALAELAKLNTQYSGLVSHERLSEISLMLKELAVSQRNVEDIAHTEKNNPSRHLFLTEVLPRSERMEEALAVILAEEREMEANAQRKSLLIASTTLHDALARLVAGLHLHLFSDDRTGARSLEQRILRFQDAYKEVAAQSDRFRAGQQQQWKNYVRTHAEFEPLPRQAITLRNAPDWNQGMHLFETKAFPQGAKIREVVEKLVGVISDRVKRDREDVAAATSALSATLLASTLVAIIIGSIVGITFSRQIVSGIQSVVARAHRIAAGDLSGEDIAVRSKDEVGELAASFNDMRSSLRDLAGQIGQATENVSSTAAEILASTQQQAAATKQQAASVQEITGTIEEINQSGAQIGERAKQVSATVEATSNASQVGLKATEETSQTMEAIRTQVEEVAENIVGLCERTQTIGEIIATVSDIAEQSNLLALNASIEAASAGTQGGRFSVVAHEMKNLADRAKDCTVQVRTILGEVQKGINSSVMLTEGAVKRVESGKQQAGATENTIRQMSDMTERSIQAFQQILGGTNQQQIGVAQVTQGMQDIRQAVTQTAAGTSQLEKAAANLNALSHQLRTAVERYRV